jgi:hypothetical protein
MEAKNEPRSLRIEAFFVNAGGCGLAPCRGRAAQAANPPLASRFDTQAKLPASFHPPGMITPRE